VKTAIVFCSLALSILIATQQMEADELVGWETSGIPGNTSAANGAFGPSPFSPSNTAAGVATVLGLTRGSGVTTNSSGAARGWGGNSWNSDSEADAITANQYFTFGFAVDTGYSVSLSALNEPAYRRSGSAGPNGELQYSLNGGDFVDFAALSFSSSSGSGAALTTSPIDLSSISALQNLTSGTVVTFRQVIWGGTSAAGNWYLYDLTSTPNTVSDLSILGNAFTGTPASVATWNPGATANWNSTDTNWLKNGTPGKFAAGDIVHFDDTGVSLQGGNVVVDAAGVSPTSIIVSNNSGTYTFSGGSIGGNGSLSKSGAGTLVLTANNSYAGGTNITGGVVEFTADHQLGNPAGALSINNATLKSDLTVAGSNLLLDPARAVNGNSATIDIAPSTTLTVQGNATFGGTLTLANSGTLALTGGTRNLGSVTFATASKLKIGAVPADAANIGGDINVTDGSGTTTIDGSLNFSGGRTITVASGGKLIVTGGLSDTTFLTIAGTGTVDAMGNNSGLPTAIDVGANAAVGQPGPTFVVHDSNSLGSTGSSFMFFNTGTIKAEPVAPATSITFTTIKTSISTVAAAPAIYDGADMEFQGTVRLHLEAAGPNVITVNNNTTFSAGWGADNGTGVKGLTVNGAGSLTLSNSAGGDFSAFDVPIVVDTATLNMNAQATSAGVTSLTAQNGGKIRLGVDNAFSAMTNVVLSGSGTLNTGGKNQSLGALAVIDHGAIDLGAASASDSVNFANSSGASWGELLQIRDWKYGVDHLLFGSDHAGLTAAQLASIKFADFAQGATISATGEVTPLRGDVNQDGFVNAADISALMQALTDQHAYQAAHSFTASDAAFILDANGDGQVTNADLQNLLGLVQSILGGAGSSGHPSTVPEPTGIALLAFGGLIVAAERIRFRSRIKSAF
jgi:autotransporter-associated beta strand protein